MGERKKMKIQSKSAIIKEIVSKIDQILSKVPDNDYNGNPIEDSYEFGRYQGELKKLFYTTQDGSHKTFISDEIAKDLIHDELFERKQ
jgi:hypothetical protein